MLYKNWESTETFSICLEILKKDTNHEQQQVSLALNLIASSKENKENLEKILVSIKQIKSSSSIFRIAQESIKMEESNLNLLNFGLESGLLVLEKSVKSPNRRRWDIVRWVINASLACGYYRVLFLIRNWELYFSPSEAVQTVATTFLSRGTVLRLGINYGQSCEIESCCREIAINCVKIVRVYFFYFIV